MKTQMKIFKVLSVYNQIVDAYDDGEVISIHRTLRLATHGIVGGGKGFEIELSDEDALKHFKKGGYVLADTDVSQNKYTGLKDYTVKRIVPLEKSAAIHGWNSKAPWEYQDDGF